MLKNKYLFLHENNIHAIWHGCCSLLPLYDPNSNNGGGPGKMKTNCWEYKKCGREPGGSKAKELGICSAARESIMDGVHGGSNAGRACWVVAGTLCGGELQGSFAIKFKECEKCDFYINVRNEEFPNFEYSTSLLQRLRNSA
jgi:hypothetical protein